MRSNLGQTSAVVPAFNNEHTIQQCIESLLANKVQEVVVVDGGSKDETISIVRRFDAVCNIHLHHNVTPVGRAREIGWRAAKGRFILFLDADAFLQPDDAVEFLLSQFSDPVVAGVTCRIACANSDKILPRMRDIDFRLTYPEQFAHIGIIDCVSDPTLCGVFRRDALEAVGGFDIGYAYAEDLKLLWKLTTKGYRVLTTYNPAVFHYHRETLRDLLVQFYNHGLGRGIFMKEIETAFYGSKNASAFLEGLKRDVSGKELLLYSFYRLFTEAAFLMGYSRSVYGYRAR